MTIPRSNGVVEISIGGGLHKMERPRLGVHLDLRVNFERLGEAVSKGDNGLIADCLYEHLTALLPDLDRGLFESAPWYEIINAFLAVEDLNRIPCADQYAILVAGDEETKGAPDAWTYIGRSRSVWRHLLGKTYGWTIEEINQLWPEDAVELLMEILADEHADREFVYSLSEVAYEYNKTTKKSNYHPLRKPLWMIHGTKDGRKKKEASLLTRIRKDALPTGNIIRSK